MPNSSKRKGYVYEKEVKDDSENSGINVACHSESFDNSTVMACESYVYDTSIFPETLTTSFNLVSNYFKYIPTYFSKVWVT